MNSLMRIALAGFLVLQMPSGADAQKAPTPSQIAAYDGLFKAAFSGNLEELKRLLKAGAHLESRDGNGRTPLHVATYASHEKLIQVLIGAGADANALDNQAYDIVTIAAVANDLSVLKIVLDLGAFPGNITSPYDGTALIAASHLGHHEVVKILIDAGAPLDHINNLHWTALMEAVVLGDGGPDHVRTARYLLDAGADKTITDKDGITPYEHAVNRGYAAMIDLLK